MYKIAPSLLEADYSCLGDELKRLEDAGADCVHLDVMDGAFVPNLSFGMKMIRGLRASSKLVFDVHMMVNEPVRFAKRMKDAGADVLTVHFEACRDVKETLKEIKQLGMKAGIALKPATGLGVLDGEILQLADVVQLMTVEPGLEGQHFLPESIERIVQLKRNMKRYGVEKEIEVDGGISSENIGAVIRAGASIIVSGKAVFDGDMKQNIQKMRSRAEYERGEGET